MAEVENQIKMSLWGRGKRSGGWRESVGSEVDVVSDRLNEITGSDVTVTSINWPGHLQLPSVSWTASVKADGLDHDSRFCHAFALAATFVIHSYYILFGASTFYFYLFIFFFFFCFLSIQIRSTGFDVESVRKSSSLKQNITVACIGWNLAIPYEMLSPRLFSKIKKNYLRYWVIKRLYFSFCACPSGSYFRFFPNKLCI